MFYYKNVSSSEKTFHGVTFKPGEIKQVSKYINHKFMIPVSTEALETNKQQKKPSSEPLKNDAPAKEDPKSNQKEELKKDEQKKDSKDQPKQDEKKDEKSNENGQKS